MGRTHIVRTSVLQRFTARLLQPAIILLSVSAAALAGLGVAPRTALALTLPPSVQEFQPTLNAANPNAPANHAKWGGRTVSVDVDPLNNQIALAATESGGLFRTTDGGHNWSHVDGLVPFRLAAVRYSTNNDSIVLVTTWADTDQNNPGGIWRSTDGGNTWSQPGSAATLCGSPNYGAWGIAFQPANGSGDVYVGTDCGLAVSTDMGGTWTKQAMVRTTAVVAQFGNSTIGDIVDVGADNGHYRFNVKTGTVSPVSGPDSIGGNGGLPRAAIQDLALAPGNPNVLLSLTAYNATNHCGGTTTNPKGTYGLYESDNGGLTWTAQATPLSAACPSRLPWVAAHDTGGGNFSIFWSGGLDTRSGSCSETGTNDCPATLNSDPTAPNVATEHADQNGLAFDPSANCPEYLATDGGLQNTTDCGANFHMAAGSGMNGGYNALQVYEVAGQIHPTHTDLYFGTQDNDVWGSPDNGSTWPNAICCEGFYFQPTPQTSSDTNQVVPVVTCGPCSNRVGAAHFDGSTYNSPPGAAWPLPSTTLVPTTCDDPPACTKNTQHVGNPFLLAPGVYLESGTFPTISPNTELFIGTVTNSSVIPPTVSWQVVNGPAGTPFQITDSITSRPFVAGPSGDPTVYQTYCIANCGLNSQRNGIEKITGVRTGGAALTHVDTNGGFTGVGVYCDGQGAWLCPPALGVDPVNANNIIAADVQAGGTGQVKVSNDGGASWHVDTLLTNLVSGGGRYGFQDPNFGSQMHNVAWDPTNDSRILVGTEAAGIIGSLDGGNSWFTLAQSQKVTAVTSFFFDDTQNDIVASSYGRGLWKVSFLHADLSITMSHHPDPAIAGNELFWDINVVNAGPDPAPSVQVVDQLPAQVAFISSTASTVPCNANGQTLTCAVGDMAANSSVSFSIRVQVNANTVVNAGGPTSITNSASVKSAFVIDNTPADNTVSDTVIVDDQADLVTTKSCDSSVLAGQTGKCTIYVDNNGPSWARSVTLTDAATSNGTFTMSSAVPSQGSCSGLPQTGTSTSVTCSLGNLAPASVSGPGRATVVVSYTANEGQTINDTATASSPTPDPTSSDNQASGSLSVTAMADLQITSMTATPNSVIAGMALTYSTTIKNNGPSTAQTVVLSESLPAGVTVQSITAPGASSCTTGTPGSSLDPATCGFGVMGPGATATMTIVTNVLPATTGILHADASVTSATFDNNNANNYAHTDTTVQVQADLSLAMTNSPNPVLAGQSATITSTISSVGPSLARNVTLNLTLPVGTALTSYTISNGGSGTCAPVVNSPGQIACTLNDIAPNQSVSVYVTVAVSASQPGGLDPATGSATTSSNDPTVPDNATTSLTVATQADISAGLTTTNGSHVYSPSTSVTFVGTATDAGPSDAQSVQVVFNLPGSKVGSVVSNTGGCTTAATTTSTTVTCSFGTLAAGTSRSVQVQFFIQGNKGTLNITDSVTSPTADPTSADNSASWSIGSK